MKSKQIILVLGCHRSGTSALTGALSLLGCGLPARVQGGTVSNPKGHFEPTAIAELHDQLFKDIGSTWDDPTEIVDSWYESAQCERYIARLIDIVHEDFGDSALPIIKEPRLCRVIPMWRKVFAKMGLHPLVVTIARRPSEVTESLKARDGIGFRQGIHIWLRNQLDSEFYTRDCTRCFVSFEELLRDCHATLKRVQAELKVSFPNQEGFHDQSIDLFLEPSLKHHNQVITDPEEPHLLRFADRAYQSFERLRSNPGDNSVLDDLSTHRTVFKFLQVKDSIDGLLVTAGKSPTPASLDWNEEQCIIYMRYLQHYAFSSAQSLLLESKKTKDQLEATLAAKDEQIISLQSELATRNEQVASASQDLASKDERLKHLEQVELKQTEDLNQLQARAAWLEQVVQSATQWQAKPWFTRAFDKWHPAEQVIAAPTTPAAEAESSSPQPLPPDQDPRRPDAEELIRNSGFFDAEYYGNHYPDIVEAGVDRFFHYVHTGRFEGRTPSERFDPEAYFSANLDLNRRTIEPLFHYLTIGIAEKRPLTPSSEPIEENIDPEAAKQFVEYRLNSHIEPLVKLIAFYLPQFHPFPENDLWWGKGFTEWTNVGKAKPNYDGHYQPHCPIHLGYYDLRVPEVMQEQARLARQYGIYGFSYYFYWFGGKVLMDTPLKIMLRTPEINIPFCLTWANENWTRRWDGQDNEILISQNHSNEDSIAFIQHIVKYFRDDRYIKIDGKPVLVVYRPDIIPNMAATTELWREEITKHGFPGIYLICAQTFNIRGPEPFGFDASLEFPPHGMTPVPINYELEVSNPQFNGRIYNYAENTELFEKRDEPPYKLFRSCMLGWDNTARRQNDGHIFHHFSLTRYKEWLSANCQRVYTNPKYGPEEKLVFVNAWNEWAEGTHLEPDRRYGYGSLQTTYEVLKSYDEKQLSKLSVLVVGHDTFRAGAQIALFENLSEWKRTHQFEFRLILVNGDGELRKAYDGVCPILALSKYVKADERESAIKAFVANKPHIIYSNTCVNGPILRALNWLDCPVVTHVHELQMAIERWAPGEVMQSTLEESTNFIACSNEVRENLTEKHLVKGDSIMTILESINLYTPKLSALERETMTAELEIGDGDIVIIGCGTTDWRKGPDLFIQIATLARAKEPRLRFIWIGSASSDYVQKSEHAKFIGRRTNARNYFSVGHVFLLTSREDPFPLVVLEAAEAGLPTVCFEKSGGIPEFVKDEAGLAVPFGDVQAAADAVLKLAADDELRSRLGANARKKVVKNHSSAVGSYQAANFLRQLVPKKSPVPSGRNPLVSIIVPNYNHTRFLAQRLESIREQTIPDFEVILLDDCSPDGSLAMLESFVKTEPRSRLVRNETNQGTFRQWRKGLSHAKGKYIWIAESDDAAELDFLELMLDKLEKHPRLALAYSASRMIDENGRDMGLPWDWLGKVDPYRWRSDYLVNGIEEIKIALLKQNTILNASSVVIRNFPGIEKLIEENMQLCSDWLFWIRLCERGEVAYCHQPLNLWRQGSSNARKRPPGEVEWIEGEKILLEASRIARKSPEETEALLAEFKAKCKKWVEDAVAS